MKTWGVNCAVSWCVCLAKIESQYCAVHTARGKQFRPTDGAVSVECADCEGSGECEDCDGEGAHSCEHAGCYDEHQCPTCEGSGKCQECADERADHPEGFDARYLTFAFDPGWVPPAPPFDRPWELG